MPRIVERWLLFKYVNGEFTPLSKPLKKKEQAEKARQKYPERERKTIGVGVIRNQGLVRRSVQRADAVLADHRGCPVKT